MGIVKASDETIAAAAAHLRAGRLVAFPTETGYGLGADATNGEAVAAIFATKGPRVSIRSSSTSPTPGRPASTLC